MTARRTLVPALLAFALLGLASPAFAAIWYRDLDGDGYGNNAVWVDSPTQPAGYVAIGGDCNDGNPSINPSRPEVCNGVDDNCNAVIDEGVKSTFYLDADGDGFGTPSSTTQACGPPPGYAANAADCDDTNAAVHPFAPEVCNGIDDDCDGTVDEGLGTTWYPDADGDGHGSTAGSVIACAPPPGYVATNNDCDDTNPSTYPGAPETCNAVDDDCDGVVDEDSETLWYPDADGDGYGDTRTPPVAACSAPPGYVALAGDCDDSNPAVSPGAPEICNGIDDDCDGWVDQGQGTIWYPDQDGDGYGHVDGSVAACSQPPGYVANAGDCDDTNDAVHPGAAESCNGVDDDCDGQFDEGACAPFQILGIADVGNDQGRRVRVRWNREDNDRPNMPVTITSYSVYRLVQDGLAKTPSLDATPPGTWDYVMSVPASGETSYSVVVPTLCDSTAGGICWSTFFVRAHTPAPLTSFDTAPAQGYSIDNLAPGVPQALVVTYSPAGNTLAWDGEAEPDLSHWRIYRGTNPAFVPSAATLVHSTATPQWTDGASGPTWHYKVTAVDFAGNEGPAASYQGTTGVGDAAISGFRLHGAAPNPSHGNALVSFDVPASGGEVELQVFDPSGRLAATLARGFRAAGTHRVQWDGRGSAGRDLPSGTYYLRFRTPAGTFTRRLTLVR